MTTANLEALWAEHTSARFPQSARGIDIDGIDLVMLDSDIAGCVSYFLKRHLLDQERVRILEQCAIDIQNILPKLDTSAHEYFKRLGQLAKGAINENGKDECSP